MPEPPPVLHSDTADVFEDGISSVYPMKFEGPGPLDYLGGEPHWLLILFPHKPPCLLSIVRLPFGQIVFSIPNITSVVQGVYNTEAATDLSWSCYLI